VAQLRRYTPSTFSNSSRRMNTIGFIGLGTMGRPMADLGREIKRSAE
jgi:hypothetical protein